MEHITWSVEVGNRCPCGGETMLLTPSNYWRTAGETAERNGEEEIDLGGTEITCHYCPTCRRVVSLSLNQPV